MDYRFWFSGAMRNRRFFKNGTYSGNYFRQVNLLCGRIDNFNQYLEYYYQS